MWNKVERTSPMVFHRKRFSYYPILSKLNPLIPGLILPLPCRSVLLSHPIESHLFLRRLAKLSKSKNDKLAPAAKKFLEKKSGLRKRRSLDSKFTETKRLFRFRIWDSKCLITAKDFFLTLRIVSVPMDHKNSWNNGYVKSRGIRPIKINF